MKYDEGDGAMTRGYRGGKYCAEKDWEQLMETIQMDSHKSEKKKM